MKDCKEKYKELCEVLCKNIKDKYEILNEKIDENIWRNTKPIMGNIVENEIAKLINCIIDNKDYKYIIDAQLSIEDKGKKGILRPDIIIVKDGMIKYIIEVKAQLGHTGKIDLFKYSDIQEILIKLPYIKYKEIQFEKDNKDEKGRIEKTIKCDKSVKTIFINLLEQNSRKNEPDLKILSNVRFFELFKKGCWYNDISYENIQDNEEYGFKAFIDYIYEQKN